MFGETTIFYVKIWNHPIETAILKWMFQVPGFSLPEAFEGNLQFPKITQHESMSLNHF